MAVPTYIGANATRGSTQTVLAHPSALEVGDLILVAAWNNGNKTDAPAYPSITTTGYQLLLEATGDNDVIDYNFGARASARVWFKVADEAAVTSPSNTTIVDATGVLSAALICYRGTGRPASFNVTANVSAVHGTTLTAPSVNLTRDGHQACFFGATTGDPGVIPTLTPESSLTQRAETEQLKASSLVADVTLGAGASGARTATTNDVDYAWVAFSVAVAWGPTVAPPARLFPREDGLGVGGGRHFPPPKSQQRSNRRFGYY